MEHRRSLLGLFVAAAARGFGHFGGVPLERLSNTARRQYKREYAGNHNTNMVCRHAEGRSCTRALAFKAKHGHFATDTAGLYVLR